MKRITIVLKNLLFVVTISLASSVGLLYWNIANSSVLTMLSSEKLLPSLAPMLERVMPSVVSIDIEGNTSFHGSRLPQQFQPFFSDNSPFCQKGSPFKKFSLCQESFSNNNQKEKFKALGSGVIIDSKKGYVVTNSHVIENSNKIYAKLHDGRRYEAEIIGKDSRSDIALIQLKNAINLIAIKISDSNFLRVGDYTVAIGNPYGLGETVTSGIISALGRSGLNIENYENFIQTDAAINRGNSGGALINLHGELIGINTAILAPEGGNIGIGFAIPCNMVKNLINQMIHYGKIKRGELGIIGTELNSELASVMKINAQKGAFISQILPKSPADKAGIKAGDTIISLNERLISSFSSLRAELGSLPIATKVKLGLLRNNKLRFVIVELQKINHDKMESASLCKAIEGANLSNYELNGNKAVKVDNVKSNTAAERLGLKENDIILAVNQKTVLNLEGLKKILDSKPEILAFHIKRGDTTIYLVLQY